MRKMILTRLLIALMFGVSFVSLGYPVAAVSCPAGSERSSAPTLAECNLPKNSTNLWKTVNNAINVGLGVLGVVAVVMIIIGGTLMMTSYGDATKVAKGKNTIMYGVIGLAVALLAFAIVNFVLKNVFK